MSGYELDGDVSRTSYRCSCRKYTLTQVRLTLPVTSVSNFWFGCHVVSCPLHHSGRCSVGTHGGMRACKTTFGKCGYDVDMWIECTRASRAAFCCAALRLFRAVYTCPLVCVVRCSTRACVLYALDVSLSFSRTGHAECMITEESTTSGVIMHSPDSFFQHPRSSKRGSRGYSSHLSCFYVLTVPFG